MEKFLILALLICPNAYAMDKHRLPYEYDWQTLVDQPYKNRVMFSSHPSPEKEEKIHFCQVPEKNTPVEKEKVKKGGGQQQ